MQLSSYKFTKAVKSTLELSDDMPLAQRRLVETVISLLGATLEEEFSRRNTAINAIASYCKFKEGGPRRRRKLARRADPLLCLDTNPQVITAIVKE